MSQENVETVRRGNAAFRRGDWEGVAANMDEHVLVRTDPRWPEQYVYGRQAAVAFYRELWESGGPDVRIDEIRDLGDRVLARLTYVMRGQSSGR